MSKMEDRDFNLDILIDIIGEIRGYSEIDVKGFKAHYNYMETLSSHSDSEFMDDLYVHVTSALEERKLDVVKMMEQMIERYKFFK